jgi:hypothetical protein
MAKAVDNFVEPKRERRTTDCLIDIIQEGLDDAKNGEVNPLRFFYLSGK